MSDGEINIKNYGGMSEFKKEGANRAHEANMIKKKLTSQYFEENQNPSPIIYKGRKKVF